MSASVIARIAKIVPLAVVAAIGVTACGPTEGGAAVAASAPVTTPAAASSATPGAGAVPAVPTAPATATAPNAPAAAPAGARTEAKGGAEAPAVSTAKTAAKTAVNAGSAAKPAPATPGGGIGITFGGLREGGKIELNDLVPFTVTWKNNDATGTRGVAPVVATQQYEGAPCTLQVAAAEGTLERKDASGWKTLDHLSMGGGMDYAGTANDAAFTLAAGESRTIEYRMRLSTANRPGHITIEADAPVPNSKNYLDMAKAELNAVVVDSHSPEILSVRLPAKGVITKDPIPFDFKVSSPDGTAGLRPQVSLWSAHGLNSNDVTLEALVGDVWQPVAMTDDCGPVADAPNVPGAGTGNTVEYTFRVTFKETPKSDVDIRVSAASNGHKSAERSVLLRAAN
ncbi:hypothetical protein [Kitasatospora brasiliensis]|uniref:hypothetical protein n=1 Tax=Kitasatospora brasiliensis TaxID=3058040 RepID=UPI002930FC3C|nr:hypothetical protein [Kitasatospora sp. K002]